MRFRQAAAGIALLLAASGVWQAVGPAAASGVVQAFTPAAASGVVQAFRPAVLLAERRGAPPPGAPGGQPPPGGQRGGGGRGRGGVVVMTLNSMWPDGGQIPVRYTQAGSEDSPPLEWTNAPEGVASYALIMHDVDAAVGTGTDDVLHWMVWNIPGTQTTLAGSQPRGAQLPNGIRQISATGPNYRGPGAPAAGPMHHYVFELFALDTTLDVPAVGAQPPQTRAAVVAAMAGHVRGKAVYVGLFKRNP